MTTYPGPVLARHRGRFGPGVHRLGRVRVGPGAPTLALSASAPVAVEARRGGRMWARLEGEEAAQTVVVPPGGLTLELVLTAPSGADASVDLRLIAGPPR